MLNLTGGIQSKQNLNLSYRNKVGVEFDKEEVITPGNIAFTRPIQGNIHSFKNVRIKENNLQVGNDPFVYLDVLVPHYNFLDRNCNFYTPLTEKEFKIHGFPSDYETDSVDQEIKIDDFFEE